MKRYEMEFDLALDYLQVSRSTLNRWIRDGKIPARKVGGQWRFSQDDLRTLRDGSGEPNPTLLARQELKRFLETSRANRKESSPMNATVAASRSCSSGKLVSTSGMDGIGTPASRANTARLSCE